MFRQSPSRTQRSKGFKTKHGLQIFLLIAICFWLLYQVKHSHDKKKAYDESSIKLSSRLDEEHETTDAQMIGRKGLPEKFSGDDRNEKEEVMEGDEEDDKPEEEEEEEEIKPEEEGEKNGKHEEEKEKNRHEEDEEINKDEEEETEEEENKTEENEEEGRGAGDDEIDEQDQAREEEEAEHDVVDEQQEKGVKEDTEQGEIRGKLEQMENAGSSEDQDHDRNTQEAREENYKRDDASSAVVREPHLETTESERGNLNVVTKEKEDTGEMNKKLEMENTNATTSGEDNKDQIAILDENVESNSSVILKTDEEKGINGSQISTTISNPDKISEVGNSRGGSNLGTFNGTENINITSATALPKATENEEVDKGKVSDASKNVETLTLGEQTGTSGSAAQNNSVPSTANENNNGTQSEGTNATDSRTEEADDSKASLTTSGNTDVVQSATNSSNSNIITEEENEARIDLGTLPEIETVRSDKDDADADAAL